MHKPLRQRIRIRLLFSSLALVFASVSASADTTTQGNVRIWNFDDVTAPALPQGWSTHSDGVTALWKTQDAIAQSAPNAAHIAESESAGEASLYSPSVLVGPDDIELEFRHRWILEASPYDGGVLDLAIDGGNFSDILAAGGSFVTGGYNETLFGCCGGNPIGGRAAWTAGTQASFIITRVTLPAAAIGRNVQFRWRFGTDSSTAASAPNGWWLDSVRLGPAGATQPKAEAVPGSLDFAVQASATSARAITLGNIGTGTLDFSARTIATDGDCASSPPLSWLSATPASRTLDAGQSTNLWVAARTDALAIGDHEGILCVVSNDPDQAVLRLPIHVQVTAAVADLLFCDGFEAGGNGACATNGSIVRSGPLNWQVPEDFSGLAIDLVTGAHGPDTGAANFDINLYAGSEQGALSVYWYADLVPAFVGGIVETTTLDARYSVLQPGGRIEQSSFYAHDSKPLDIWLDGGTGYLGFQFFNEQTGQVNHGYLHLQANGPRGFPATILDYAYDRAGNAITIP